MPSYRKKYYSTPPNLFLGFQPPNLPQFTPKALQKGTLWPVFMTIMKILIKRAVTTDVTQSLPEEYYELLLELQELDFVLVELTLYLDTHPDDTAAINQFNDFSYKRRVLKQKMEEKYGPLQQFGNSYSNAPWEWSKGPWPWQI